MSLPLVFDAAMKKLVGIRPPAHIGLSISGGVDSMALASLTMPWAKQRGIDLTAFVIDHGLREGSDTEARSVCRALETLQIPAVPLALDLSRGPSSTMESRARDLRRQVLIKECHDRGIRALMHGHTLNDQHELFLQRLIGHSGWYGLGCMHPSGPLSREFPPGKWPITLLKPLLEVSKPQLIEWCTENNVPWVEDPTNQDPTLTRRNAIRKLLADYSSQLAPSLRPPRLTKIIAAYSDSRESIQRQVDVTMKVLKQSGSLKVNNTIGTATLTLEEDFEALGPKVRAGVLYSIIRHISPVSAAKVGYRREAISDFVKRGYNGENGASKSVVLLNVLISKTSKGLAFSRAFSRRTERGHFTTYDISNDYSDWNLLDGRFWFQFRMEQPSAPARIAWCLEPDLQIVKPLLKSVFNMESLPHDNLLKSQPFFILVDRDRPCAIDRNSLVGYPTLGLSRSIAFNYEYKQLFV